MICLFIGGSHDGRLVDIARPQPFMCMPELQEVEYADLTSSSTDSVRTIETYRKFMLRVNRDEFVQYAIEGMTDTEAALALFNGYKGRGTKALVGSSRELIAHIDTHVRPILPGWAWKMARLQAAISACDP